LATGGLEGAPAAGLVTKVPGQSDPHPATINETLAATPISRR
jgi:hypothetical protein